MPIPFPFEFMVLFGILAIMLLIGVLLRAKFSFFQKFLIPSCLIGGLLGFEEGPGQALAFGKVWEGNGFENAATIGVTFATIGFFFAFFIGVPLVNWGIRKGLSTNTPGKLPRYFLTGILPRNQETTPAGRLRLHPANIDTLAFQAACIGLVYLFAYLFVRCLGQFFSADVASMLWGFFFFFGLIIAFSVRWLMGLLKVLKLWESPNPSRDEVMR